jgi:ATP-binding cassette, subfamily A (ABC1), member 3
LNINNSGEKELYSDEEISFGLWAGSRQEDRSSELQIIFKQFMALFKKRLIHSLRNRILIIVQILVPISALLINLLYLKYGPIKPTDSPALEININKYKTNFIPYVVREFGENSSMQAIKEIAQYYHMKLNSSNLLHPFNLNQNSLNNECSSYKKELSDLLKCMGRFSLNQYADQFMVAAEFFAISSESVSESINIIGHFNNQPYHIPPLTLNLISNSLYKYYSKSSTNTINVINHPLPRTLDEKVNDNQSRDATSFNVASGLTFGFSFLIASFTMFLIKERVSTSKHLQFMSGCNVYVYWISSFIWDILNYLIPLAFTIILLKVNIY